MKRPGKALPEQAKQLKLSLNQLQDQANVLLNAPKLDTKALKKLVLLLKPPLADIDVEPTEVMLVLEVIFKNLLKRKFSEAESKTYQRCLALYEDFWILMLEHVEANEFESPVALRLLMQLLSVEAKQSLPQYIKGWPVHRLSSILEALINSKHTPALGLKHFNKYVRCLDVLPRACKLLAQLTPKDFTEESTKAFNYLALVNMLDTSKAVISSQQYHVAPPKRDDALEPSFKVEPIVRHFNTIWQGIMEATRKGLDPKLHKQILVVLLERLMPHLRDPIQLTDFLMDSLNQFGGAIALLALQGIFTLMQQQNITYPDVYEKLYNMFYPQIFHNKYKARLFYLADIFLTSTHLPESLVAAFVKRLARLALKSPTEDALIMIRFICNLLLRHTGLQCLVHATPAAASEAIVDPYDAEEQNPVKSRAMESSLWEMLLLQKHAVPEISQAARFISQSLPLMEFDLAPLLEKKESDMFEEEVKKKAKQFMLNYERPLKFALPKHDLVTKYWDL